MNCQTCRAEIEELEAGAPLGERAGAHVRVCPECWAFHDEREALRRLVGSLGPVGAPPDFDFRLRARLAAAKADAGQRAPWLSFLSGVPAVSLAAAFALLVAGFVIYQQTRPSRPANQTAARQAEQGNTVEDSNRPGAAEPAVTPEVARNENPPAAEGGKPARAIVKHSPRRNVTSQSVTSQSAARAPQIISNDSAALTAKETAPERGQPLGAVVELPVRPASQPVRVSFDERGGARRTVTLEPVVFGSQDLAGRIFSRASAPQDIW
jgi:hypothetical protein